MIKTIINRIIVPFVLGLISIMFIYQCHPNQSDIQSLDEYKRNTPPLKLDDIKEKAIVKNSAEMRLY